MATAWTNGTSAMEFLWDLVEFLVLEVLKHQDWS
jgi:hypothetical protein